MLPAFGDGHVHPLWGGVELAGPPVREATLGRRGRRGRPRVGARTPGRRLGAGRSLRPDPGPRRPVRRGLAGRRRPGPAGGAPVDRPPLRLGEHRGAAPGRHRRRHPRPAGRRGRPAAGRQPAGDARRVDRDGPRAAPRPAGHRRRADRRAGRGQSSCWPRPASPGCRRPRSHPTTSTSTCAPRPPAGSPSARTSPCGPSRTGGRSSAPSSSRPGARPRSRRSPVRCRRGP